MKSNLAPPAHLWTSIAAVMMAHTFDVVPRGAMIHAKTAAPWMMLVVGAVAFLLIWPVAATLARQPGRNLLDISLDAGGRPLAIAVALVFLALVIGVQGTALRMISEMAVTALFPHTPQTFLMSSTLIVASLGAAMSPASLLWLGHQLFWPVLIGLLLVLVGNIGWGEISEVLPLAGPGLLPLSAQVFPLTSYFNDLMAVAVFSRYISQPGRLVTSTAKAAATGTIVICAVILVTLTVFPYPGGLAVQFPVFEMTRLIRGGRFFENLDALWVVVWTVGLSVRMSGGFMIAALLFRDAFRLPDHRLAILPIAVATLASALFPSNQEGVISGHTFFATRWGFLITLILPLMVTLLWRVRRGGRHA